MKRIFYTFLLAVAPLLGHAQIGSHRSDLSIGVNGGMAMSNVGFTPKVTQKMLPGVSGGLSMRYVCEKYFSTICSIYAELDYTQMGWREDILDMESKPVLNKTTGQNDKYDRVLTYIQLPVLAHLAWGQETKGFNFFIDLGPQFGYLTGEKAKTNFTLDNANFDDRANKVKEQYSMEVENKFDYGICLGLGLEYSHPSVGHFLLSGRYYYGLGNLYGSTKRDYFAKSNNGGFTVRLAYLVDLK